MSLINGRKPGELDAALRFGGGETGAVEGLGAGLGSDQRRQVGDLARLERDQLVAGLVRTSLFFWLTSIGAGRMIGYW
jgi:hypothetical protein